MENEILSDDELEQITGYKARAWQRKWLAEKGWHFVESRGGRPLVGRHYARIQLGAPSAPQQMAQERKPIKAWTPDLSKVS